MMIQQCSSQPLTLKKIRQAVEHSDLQSILLQFALALSMYLTFASTWSSVCEISVYDDVQQCTVFELVFTAPKSNQEQRWGTRLDPCHHTHAEFSVIHAINISALCQNVQDCGPERRRRWYGVDRTQEKCIVHWPRPSKSVRLDRSLAIYHLHNFYYISERSSFFNSK